MSNSQFIGRGEALTALILQRPLLILKEVLIQVPIELLVNKEDYNILDQEIKNHKCDLVVSTKTQTYVIEVNYKHKEKASKKWNNIFVPLLKKSGKVPVTIDDYDTRSLFKLSKNKDHKLSWDDFRDLIDALEKAGVNP